MNIIKDKSEIMEIEVDKIYHLLDDKYADNFDFIERDENSIRLTLEFNGYDYENIEIKPVIINDYGVIKYDITIETYSSDNEIETSDYHYCLETDISEKKALSLNRKAEKDADNWIHLYKKSVTPKQALTILRANSGRLITIENIILNRDCYKQITHQHTYKAKRVTLNTPHLVDIIPFIELREFFYGIGD